MKKIISAISGKKALIVVTVLACICTVLEIVTSIRNSTKVDYMAICAIFVAIVAWAEALKKNDNRKDK